MPSGRRGARLDRQRPLGWLLTAAVVTAGCQHSAATARARFNDGPGARPGCLMHQNARPSAAYTGGAKASTDRVLALLAHYTAHGTEPYCDGRPPTAIDQTWAGLYVQFGADASRVAPILRPGS